MRISVQTVPAISEYQCHSGIFESDPESFRDWNFESEISLPIAIGTQVLSLPCSHGHFVSHAIQSRASGRCENSEANYNQQAERLSKNSICLFVKRMLQDRNF
jgi:hypothetical protein